MPRRGLPPSSRSSACASIVLPGAGLAGDHVQSRPERQLGALDQQQVPDSQLREHRVSLAVRVVIWCSTGRQMSLHVESGQSTLAQRTEEHNPYLEGPYAATQDEVTLHGLEVLEGEIPADLNGVYVRNGPNPQHQPRRALPLVRRRRHGARRPLRGRARDLSQPLGAHRRVPRRARRRGSALWHGHHGAVRREPAPTCRRRTRRTRTSCSTAIGCSRCGTGRASRTRSTR